jgi:hypothetical protein
MLKKFFIAAGTLLMVSFCVFPSAHAITMGTNITIPEGVSSGTGWYGGQEDNEVEPGNVTSQVWDLEGFYLNGSKLAIVGGYNFILGVASGGKTYSSGDVFIDMNGDAVYGNSVPSNIQTSSGVTTISNSYYRYEYALDLSFATMTYAIYDIDNNDSLLSVYFDQNDRSNPWRYQSGGSFIGSGVISSGVLSAADALVYGLKGDAGNTVHYYIMVDLSFIGGKDFTSHFTMECGNDDLMGRGHVKVPEPGSLLLLGFGIFAAAGTLRFSRK